MALLDFTSGVAQVPSPVATGGGGTVFEQNVDAALLSLLLVQGIPPVLTDCCVTEVHLQTAHKGWRTDDVLLVGRRGDCTQRQLAIQVKRSFTVSDTDTDCRQVFGGFWDDVHNPTLFDRERDALALVVQRGTDVLLGGLGALLDSARASKDSADFNHRLVTRGLLSAKSVRYAGQIREIVKQKTNAPISDEAFWTLLRAIHVLSFDLATSTKQTEAWAKTMLAQTACGHDKLTIAAQTWGELIEFAGTMMSAAGSVTIADLPESARARHTAIAQSTLTAFGRLRAHSQTVLRAIRTNICGLELPRAWPTTKLLDLLVEGRAVIVTGPAGSGKSALAKLCLTPLASDTFVLAFRAEEFATAHLDESLHNSQIDAGSEELFALLSGQARKVILVESVERLLESSKRDAFLDLLRLVADDPTWRLIVTCRDYSLETVRAAFFDSAGLQCGVFVVPELTDEELTEVTAAIPALRRPVGAGFLNRLLRNPYYLDRAAAMSWPADATLPETERAFREQFWRDVVRDDGHRSGGMPKRRDQAFVEVCIERARALAPYVGCDDLDAEVLERLHADNLIAYSPQGDRLAAPAHDALEDWAVLRWIEAAYDLTKPSHSDLVARLGSFPAIRRAYRKWVTELVDVSPDDADGYVTGVLLDATLPAYFRDDTLVSVLLSPMAPDFLNRASDIIARDDFSLLRRIMHLTRVACRTVPPWISPVGEARCLCVVPSGPAWASVLRLVRQHLEPLVAADLGLVVGLIVDWAVGVSFLDPHPEGMHFAASIAHKLLPHLDDYGRRSAMDDIIKAIIRIPMGDERAFAALATRASVGDRTDYVADKFAELLLAGPYAAFACADMPDVVIALAQAHFPEPQKRGRLFDDYHPFYIGRVFGLRDHLDFEFDEASALRGPFLPLLQNHPEKGIRFILDTLNSACEFFAQRHQNVQYVDGPWQVDLSFTGGTVRTQWCEHRLWGLYRRSVGPHVLQCALMALERWLLYVGDHAPKHLERWLVRLLHESNNVAVSAVVASVATAHPRAAGEAGLALLSCRDLILLDKNRAVEDQMPPSSCFPSLSARTAESQLYADERRQSDRLPHRKLDLEWVAIALSGGPLRSQVYAILDAHRAALPPEDQQGHGDKVWRLALHRMDFRRYAVVEDSEVEQPSRTSVTGDADNASAQRANHVVMMPQGLEPDLEAFRQEDAPRFQHFSKLMSLHLWGMSCFQGERRADCNPEGWRERLSEAKTATQGEQSGLDEDRLLRNAPGFVAAVCVRDHWAEMDEGDRRWCVHELLSCIRRDAEQDDLLVRASRNALDASRPCAFVLPLVLSYEMEAGVQEELRQTIAVALTHACDEVITHAIEGIRAYLTTRGPAFLLSCVRALARRAVWLVEAWNRQQKLDYASRLPPEQLSWQVRAKVKEAVLSNTVCTVDDLRAVDLEDPWGREAMGRILAILRDWPDSPLTREAFALVAGRLVSWWDADQRRRHQGERRDFHSEFEYLKRLAGFCTGLPAPEAVAACAPLLGAVQAHRKELAQFIDQLTIAVDQGGGVGAFWALWQEFAKQTVGARWLDQLDYRDEDEDAFLSALFLGGPWKEGVRHWRCLEGFSQLLDQLFEALPVKPTVFRCYARFLMAIGERSLPHALELLSRKLREGDAQRVLSDQSVTFCLEVLLRRHVYGTPGELKAQEKLRNAVLHLLDELVAAGSSAAYRMRDDFVTPGSGMGPV